MLLGIDIGSSSVKAAVLHGDHVVGKIARVSYPTHLQGPWVEVDPAKILRGIHRAVAQLGSRARKIDAIGLSVMSPAWVAMDRHGKAITPIVTHQDRRSVAEAMEIEKRLGKARHLRLAGNRPFPGGISSTTWEWFRKHESAAMRRADLVGHLNTFLIRQWTGNRIIDPSNASFTGLYRTVTQGGWSDELCENVKLPKRLLPEVIESNEVAGRISRSAANDLGVMEGVPVLAGMIDTSSAMLLTGARVGQLMNSIGSTDVLALCTDRPEPHERLLTRALGIGKRWMSVSTLAAAGSALVWAHDQLFADYSWERFNALTRKLAAAKSSSTVVRFEPYLAGDRISIVQRSGVFSGLTLSTTREQMLRAVIESLATASAARLELLRSNGTKMLRRVVVSGGGTRGGLERIIHRDWGGAWKFVKMEEATLRGLGGLASASQAKALNG